MAKAAFVRYANDEVDRLVAAPVMTGASPGLSMAHEMAAPPLRLIHGGHPDGPEAEMAFTEHLLRSVASGASADVTRVYRPGAAVEFGRRDVLTGGYAMARLAARAHGFVPIVGLVGGRAVAYDRGSVIVETISSKTPGADGTEKRLAHLARVVGNVFRVVGLELHNGELPGEHSAGRWSMHDGLGVKLVGLTQRVVHGAALTRAVVSVEGGLRLQGVMTSVYGALGLAWEPTTAGAARDVQPALRVRDVEQAMFAALAAHPDVDVTTGADGAPARERRGPEAECDFPCEGRRQAVEVVA